MSTERATIHRALSAGLSNRTDDELVALIETGVANDIGVGGGTSVIEVDGRPVFAKRISLTEPELANPGSTANLFDLPLVCQYGVGGPGFNAWRELAANQIVTEGVLAGDTEAFPLLFHWRVLPGRALVSEEHADIDGVVSAFGGSPAVRHRLEALARARSSLALFSEYIPNPVPDWLADGPVDKARAVEQQFADLVTFLHRRDLLHMDGHLGNLRTDGERIYLSDFGLATSTRFELSSSESAFAERHVDHDAGYAAMRLVNWLVKDVCGIPVSTDTPPAERNQVIERWVTGDRLDDVPPAVAAMLDRHAPAAAIMNAFYWQLFGGQLDAEYPAAELDRTVALLRRY